MSEEIKAIETFYDGYRFRSRLEARWAVFFNASGIRYTYEPDGFYKYGDRGEMYLPDFYLPGYDVYAEVKGSRPGVGDEVKKAINVMANKINRKVLLLLPDIPNTMDCGVWWLPIYYYHPLCGTTGCRAAFLTQDGNGDHGPINLTTYFAVGCRCILNAFHPEIIERELKAVADEDMKENDEYPVREAFDSDLLRNCFLKARQARFEHGESPEVVNW